MSEQDVRTVYAARERILVEALERVFTCKEPEEGLCSSCMWMIKKALTMIKPGCNALVSAKEPLHEKGIFA